MTAGVLIYNQGGVEVLARVSLKHAISMLYRGVAVVKEAVVGETYGPYVKPRAVELIRYVFAKWKYDVSRRNTYSKSGVLARDNHVCAYCGGHANTVDHVTPQCQGGKSTWLNTVASCSSCNSKKGGRTPEEAGMKLVYSRPHTPLGILKWG